MVKSTLPACSNPIQTKLVKLRFYIGTTNYEAAEVLGISVSSANNYWVFSHVWLPHEVEGNNASSGK